MNEYIHVGLDVHLDSITAAIVEGDSENVSVQKLSGDLMKVRRLFRQLAKKGPVRSCYEASGAGFVLHRVLAKRRVPLRCHRTIAHSRLSRFFVYGLVCQ